MTCVLNDSFCNRETDSYRQRLPCVRRAGAKRLRDYFSAKPTILNSRHGVAVPPKLFVYLKAHTYSQPKRLCDVE